MSQIQITNKPGGGTPGETGPRGLSVLNGAGAPNAGTGNNGEFYIDTTAHAIYGPKTAGAWGSGTSLIGPEGSAQKPLVDHAFAIQGKLKAEAYVGLTVTVLEGQEKKLVALHLRLEEGKEVTVEIRKNGTEVDKRVVKKGTPVNATIEASLANNDYIDIKLSSLEEEPGKLSYSFGVRHLK